MLTRLLWWVTRLLMLCALGTCHERPPREPPKFTNALDWLLITEGVSHLHALPDVIPLANASPAVGRQRRAGDGMDSAGGREGPSGTRGIPLCTSPSQESSHDPVPARRPRLWSHPQRHGTSGTRRLCRR